MLGVNKLLFAMHDCREFIFVLMEVVDPIEVSVMDMFPLPVTV